MKCYYIHIVYSLNVDDYEYEGINQEMKKWARASKCDQGFVHVRMYVLNFLELT